MKNINIYQDTEKIIPTVLGTQFQLQVLFGTWSFSYLLTDWLTDWLTALLWRQTNTTADRLLNQQTALNSHPLQSKRNTIF